MMADVAHGTAGRSLADPRDEADLVGGYRRGASVFFVGVFGSDQSHVPDDGGGTYDGGETYLSAVAGRCLSSVAHPLHPGVTLTRSHLRK